MEDIKPCCDCKYFKNYTLHDISICKHPSSIESIDKVDGAVAYMTCGYLRSRLEGNCPNFIHKGISKLLLLLVLLIIVGVYNVF